MAQAPSDPGEVHDEAQAHPEIVGELLGKLERWEAQMAELRWLEGPRWENNQRLKHEFSLQGRAAERRIP